MINKSLALSDDERDSVLIDGYTDIPHFYSSLYRHIKRHREMDNAHLQLESLFIAVSDLF